ncbi:hypothetical protein GCM10007907_35990 [Chitinimonas prasina]|uniref:DUF2141 domain-containing protein n=1 Tax=Chitinimonas prasina TaxID=1434937 RepID=A0ABQ5YLH9_9NEIS|nr:DUF2141 domain-containing protein [Chitinimonas prasina]GLR14809.1 hypothetical protein GCM10007907_35990 [Chitinimonas prasina]
MHIRHILPLILLTAGAAQAADLTITVNGLTNAEGKVLLAAYDSADTFLKRPVGISMADAQAGSVKAVISNLKAGDYAISLYQDKNANKKLDSNLVGMPTEPYGFSRDAAGSFGPPSFEQARISVPDSGAEITVTLR